MKEEKNELLITKNNNSILENILIKIKEFFYKSSKTNKKYKLNDKNIDEYEVINIQNKYEKDEIAIEKLSEEQYESLHSLYEKQIKQTKDEISIKEKKIIQKIIKEEKWQNY